jgi:hypothetical protein
MRTAHVLRKLSYGGFVLLLGCAFSGLCEGQQQQKKGSDDVIGTFESGKGADETALTCDTARPKPNATRVGVFVLGESVCASIKKAHIPVSKLHGLEQGGRHLWPVTSSEAEDMVKSLLKGSSEAQNLVFSSGPPDGTLGQVWVFKKSPLSVERANLVAKYGHPAQEEVKWSDTFNERYRSLTWLLSNNTVINVEESHARYLPYGEVRFTKILYISRE